MKQETTLKISYPRWPWVFHDENMQYICKQIADAGIFATSIKFSYQRGSLFAIVKGEQQ
jgi:hypothetical protein